MHNTIHLILWVPSICISSWFGLWLTLVKTSNVFKCWLDDSTCTRYIWLKPNLNNLLAYCSFIYLLVSILNIFYYKKFHWRLSLKFKKRAGVYFLLTWMHSEALLFNVSGKMRFPWLYNKLCHIGVYFTEAKRNWLLQHGINNSIMHRWFRKFLSCILQMTSYRTVSVKEMNLLPSFGRFFQLRSKLLLRKAMIMERLLSLD